MPSARVTYRRKHSFHTESNKFKKYALSLFSCCPFRSLVFLNVTFINVLH